MILFNTPNAAVRSAVRCGALCLIATLLSVSCATAPTVKPPRNGEPPVNIMGKSRIDEKRMVAFFMENKPSADRAKVARMARYYAEESKVEGVNADVAFIQMCLETGFLSFRGLVTEDMNNFCGLGSIGPGQPGNSFPDERTGVRAHVQHLKAYASSEPLSGPPTDPRYKYVNPKGKAPTIHGLAGTWAADREYGTKLNALLIRLYG